MKTVIAIPSMDQVPTRFCQSLAMLQKVGECAVGFQIGSLVYMARDALAKNAIEMGADYIFWLDSDMVFSPDTLQRMMSIRDKGDIISGLYFRRVSPYTPVLYKDLDINEKGATWSEFDDIPEEIFECGGVGFGCCLMPTEVCIDVLAKFGQMFTPINGVGEDLSFCWRARQCGYKIVCDPSVELGHVGNYVITRDFYNVFKTARGES